MSLTPIDRVTLQIQEQPGWEGVRDWGAIVRAWQSVVSPAIAERTQPKSYSRGVLTIATNSAALAHQLSFGRMALRQKLNAQSLAKSLGTRIAPIDDLRFVASGRGSNPRPEWQVEARHIPIESGEIVICDRCNCRARAGELQRWEMCRFCAIDLGRLGRK